MRYDFNALEQRARELIDAGRVNEAIRIYLFMAEGDPSLDGGYLGKKLGECYERLGDVPAARYWYGRAVEENPAREDCAAARIRLANAGAARRRTSRREQLLNVIREGNGLSRSEILERMGLKSDKSGEMSISNALAALTKTNQVRREGDKYYAPEKSVPIDDLVSL
jgi:tetratricopeptide (TPR) repeat protein